MKILIIAGHGAGDPGAVAAHGGKNYREADEARHLAAALSQELRSRGLDTEVYPTQNNAFDDCRQGCLRTSADVAVELHFNAYSHNGGDGRVKGVECWLPLAENNEPFARALCGEVAKLGFTDRGVKRRDFSVIARLRRMGIPAALLEVCFLDDADDMALYEKCRDKVPAAIADGICRAFHVEVHTGTAARLLVQEKAGLSDATMDYLAAYRWGEELLEKLAAAMA